ncbi:MAG: MBL fold metallo-hydrolase [Candidatus Bipolaricaulota bacterium]
MRVRTVCLGALATNCYVVETEAHLVVVDPATNSAELRRLLGDRRPDLVLNTHGHFDHTGGNWSLGAARIGIHREDLPVVRLFFPHHPPFDLLLEDGQEVVPGIRVMHTPGHSPGSVVFLVEGAILSGDLLFAGSIGRTDLPGGNDDDMDRSLARVVALPGDWLVYPGHGEPTTLARERSTNPFLGGAG